MLIREQSSHLQGILRRCTRAGRAGNRALELLCKTEELRLFSDRSKDDHSGAAVTALIEEGPRDTGPDHLAELARRFGRRLAVVEGGFAKSTKAANEER
jgi:hypothetical protein